MSLMSATGLAKSYGPVRALDGVDLEVPAGTLTAVLGPSGCGKTTLLRCVAGFERVDAGEVRLGGIRVAGAGTHIPPQRRRVAVVPQEGALFPHLSVGQNVAFGLGREGRRNGRVAEVLELVGLGGLDDRMPYQLSGGQQQRVAVARALAPRPPLVLLDEPFSALDAALRGELRRDVRRALHLDGATAILVTHDQGEALSIADQVAVMRDGRIVQSGSPGAVYGAPVDLWVATFVGEAVLLPATVSGAGVATALGELAVAGEPGSGAVTAMLRPEQVDVLRNGASERGGILATVTRTDFHGHDALISLRLTDGTPVLARVLGPATDATVGAEVTVRVRGAARVFRVPAIVEDLRP